MRWQQIVALSMDSDDESLGSRKVLDEVTESLEGDSSDFPNR